MHIPIKWFESLRLLLLLRLQVIWLKEHLMQLCLLWKYIVRQKYNSTFFHSRWSRTSLLKGVESIAIPPVIWLLHPHRPEAFPTNQSPEYAEKDQTKVCHSIGENDSFQMLWSDKNTTLYWGMYPFHVCFIKRCNLFLDTTMCNNKPIKPNGKLDDPLEAAGSPPRTALLGTIFSPVFNFFSPATKTGNKVLLEKKKSKFNFLSSYCCHHRFIF